MYAWHQINSSCSLLVDAFYGREKYSISIRRKFSTALLRVIEKAVLFVWRDYLITFQEFFCHEQLTRESSENYQQQKLSVFRIRIQLDMWIRIRIQEGKIGWMFSMGCWMLLLRLERHSWSPKKKILFFSIWFFFNCIILIIKNLTWTGIHQKAWILRYWA